MDDSSIFLQLGDVKKFENSSSDISSLVFVQCCNLKSVKRRKDGSKLDVLEILVCDESVSLAKISFWGLNAFATHKQLNCGDFVYFQNVRICYDELSTSFYGQSDINSAFVIKKYDGTLNYSPSRFPRIFCRLLQLEKFANNSSFSLLIRSRSLSSVHQ